MSDTKRSGKSRQPGRKPVRGDSALPPAKGGTGGSPSLGRRIRRLFSGSKGEAPRPAPAPAPPADPLDRLYEAGGYDQLIDAVELTIRRGRPEAPRRAWQYARACLDTGQPERLVATAAAFGDRSWRHRGFRSRYFQVLISLDRIPEAVAFAEESILLGAFDLDFLLRVASEHRRLERGDLVAAIVDLAYRRWGGRISRENAVFLQAILLGIGGPVAILPYSYPRRGDGFHADHYFLLANSRILDHDPAGALRHYNAALAGFGLSPAMLRDPDGPFSAANLTAPAPSEMRGGATVTVAMSTFNARDTVLAALGSLSLQTYRDLEILVIDDCSTDDTVAVAERYARESDPRVRVMQMERNGGTYRARNRALAEARGTYFTCNDADDWSHPAKIAALVEALEGGKGVAAQSQLVRLNPDIGIKPKRSGFIHDDVSSTLLRREAVIDRIGFYDPVKFGADSEYVARLEMAFGEAAVTRVAKPFLVAHWASTTLSGGLGTGISDGGIFYPKRSAYRHGYRTRHARGEGLKRGPDGEVMVSATSAEGVGGTRKGWRLEGTTLIYGDPAIDLFWRMPEGFTMPSNALLALAEQLLYRPFGRDVDIDGEATRSMPADGRIAVAFSGGIDSAAALRLLPDPIPIHTQVADPGGKHRIENALLAVKEVGGIAIVSNYDQLPTAFGERRGFFGSGGFTVTSVLLADHLGLRAVADGNIVDTVYLLGPAGHGTRYTPVDRSAHMAMFQRAGLDYCEPCAGLSEVSTELITRDLKYAMGCMRGQGGKPCGECMKCYRKGALRGQPAFSSPDSEAILARPAIPLLGALLWAAENRGLSHPRLDALRHKDISWVDKWYPRSIEYVPEDLRPYFLGRLKHYGIEPMTDPTPLETWDSRDEAAPETQGDVPPDDSPRPDPA
jgi:hypothetical protein